jgi:hypothetical protein
MTLRRRQGVMPDFDGAKPHMELLKERCRLHLQGQQPAAQHFHKVHQGKDDNAHGHLFQPMQRRRSVIVAASVSNEDHDAEHEEDRCQKMPAVSNDTRLEKVATAL